MRASSVATSAREAIRSARVYDAFVSYSHAADGRLAPAVQSGLHRFAKPWYRLRFLRVFRDESSLSADPALWEAIERALESSDWFLLLASPEAARSEWVDREVAWWLAERRPERLLVLLTAGELTWDANGIDRARTNALPASAVTRLGREPRWVDLRWARTAEDVSLANARFREAIADVVAAVLERPKDELLGEDVRQHRSTKRLVRATLAALTVLLLGAIAASVVAIDQRGQAITQRDRAVREATVAKAQALAAQAQLALTTTGSSVERFTVDRDRAVLLALESLRLAPTLAGDEALRNGLTKLNPSSAPQWAPRYPSGFGGGPPFAPAAVRSPDGHWRARTPTDPGKAVLLEDTQRRRVQALPHDWTLQAIRFSPDSRWLATVTQPVSMDAPDPRATALPGSTVRVWDVRTANELTRVSLAKEGGIWRTVFSPDGMRLATYDRDGRPRMWVLWPPELRAEACAKLRRNLSQSEWSQYIGDGPRRDTCPGLPVISD